MIIKRIITKKDGFFKGHIFYFNNDGYEIISGLNGTGKTLLMRELLNLDFKNIERILIQDDINNYKNLSIFNSHILKDLGKCNGLINHSGSKDSSFNIKYHTNEIWLSLWSETMIQAYFNPLSYEEDNKTEMPFPERWVFITTIDKKVFQNQIKYIKDENDLKNIREYWINKLIQNHINKFWLDKKAVTIFEKKSIIYKTNLDMKTLKQMNDNISKEILQLNAPNITGCILKKINFDENGEYVGNINKIIFKNNTNISYYENLSDGQKIFFSYKCLFSENSEENLLLFDEPDKYLSPNEYMKLWAELKKIKNQIFIISHSPTFIKLINKKSNINKFIGNGVYKRLEIENFEVAFKDIYKKYYKQWEWDVIIMWLFFDKTVLLEGENDIAAWLTNKIIRNYIEEKNIYLFNMKGAGNTNLFSKIIKGLDINNFKIFIDNDATTKKIKKDTIVEKSKKSTLESYLTSEAKTILNKNGKLSVKNIYEYSESAETWPFSNDYQNEIMSFLIKNYC